MKKMLLILVLLISTVGCASIVSRDKYPVTISSIPTGQEFVVYNSSNKSTYSGQTPTKINLKAGNGYFKGETYYLKFKGYSNTFEVIESNIDPWFYGNLLYLPFGFLPSIVGGCVIDPLTGNMWELPDRVHVELKK